MNSIAKQEVLLRVQKEGPKLIEAFGCLVHKERKDLATTRLKLCQQFPKRFPRLRKDVQPILKLLSSQRKSSKGRVADLKPVDRIITKKIGPSNGEKTNEKRPSNGDRHNGAASLKL